MIFSSDASSLSLEPLKIDGVFFFLSRLNAAEILLLVWCQTSNCCSNGKVLNVTVIVDLIQTVTLINRWTVLLLPIFHIEISGVLLVRFP